MVEDGEEIQIALTMTCPKATVAKPTTSAPVIQSAVAGFDWGEPDKQEEVKITQEEEDNISALMKALGL